MQISIAEPRRAVPFGEILTEKSIKKWIPSKRLPNKWRKTTLDANYERNELKSDSFAQRFGENKTQDSSRKNEKKIESNRLKKIIILTTFLRSVWVAAAFVLLLWFALFLTLSHSLLLLQFATDDMTCLQTPECSMVSFAHVPLFSHVAFRHSARRNSPIINSNVCAVARGSGLMTLMEKVKWNRNWLTRKCLYLSSLGIFSLPVKINTFSRFIFSILSWARACSAGTSVLQRRT